MSVRLPIRVGFGALPRAPYRQPCLHLHFFSSKAGPSTQKTTKINWPAIIRNSPRSDQTSQMFLLGSIRPVAQRSSLSLLRRTFSTSRSNALRQTYFPNASGRPNGSGSSWRARLRAWRRVVDSYPPMYIIYGLIGLNVGIFMLWQYAIQSYNRFKDPSLYLFMQRNLVLNESNIMAGRIWTLVTSCFSHSRGDHIFMNCLGLGFIAPPAAQLIGTSAFVGLYLAGGVISALTSLLWHRSRGARWGGSEGASGAIYTTLSFWGALNPQGTILLMFVIPMPIWLGVAGLFTYDLYGSIFRPNSGVDSAGHVGGLLAGLFFAYRLRRRGFGGIGRRYW